MGIRSKLSSAATGLTRRRFFQGFAASTVGFIATGRACRAQSSACRGDFACRGFVAQIIYDQLRALIGNTELNPVAVEFADVKSDSPHHVGIAYCAQRGMIVGTADGKFLPTRLITRYELAMILQRVDNEAARSRIHNSSLGSLDMVTLAGEPLGRGVFSDVPQQHWAYDAVAFCMQRGILTFMVKDMLFMGKRAVTKREYHTAIGILREQLLRMSTAGDS